MTGSSEAGQARGKPGECAPPAVRTCQVCGEALSAGVIVECNACHTPHHRDCWRYNRGCSTFGCTCRTFKAATADLGSPDEPFTYKEPLGWKAVVALIAGITALSLFPVPFLAFGAVGGVLCTLASIFVTAAPFLLRHELTFLPDTGRVERQLHCAGRPFGEPERDYLSADSIAEIHLQRCGGPQGVAMVSIYLALTDGTRIHLRQATAVEADGMEAEAERLARFADTTVRLVLGRRAPSATEIRQAALEKGATGGVPGHALPSGDREALPPGDGEALSEP